MRLFSKTIIVALLMASSFSGDVKAANVYYWQSTGGDVSASFPDSWARISNQNVSDLLTVESPIEKDHATCVIRADEDKRFAIFPFQFGPEIQRQYISREMWENYFLGQKNAVIHAVYDNSQLAKGWASMASASYQTALGSRMVKRGVAFASLFRNRLYTVECSAQEAAYPKYHDAFMDFIKSVDFPMTTNRALSGYYRDFISDSGVKIKGESVLQDSHY